MSERQKVAEMTKTLVNMFPDSKKRSGKRKILLRSQLFHFLRLGRKCYKNYFNGSIKRRAIQ